MTRSYLLLLVSLLMLTLGCAARPSHPPFPVGQGVALLEEPVHLGNNRATGQHWVHGPATAAMLCSLVNLPRASHAHIQVINVRGTELLADQLQVNGKGYPLPITLQQDLHNGITPLGTMQSPLYPVQLPQGPSQICLVAGQRRDGDVDDFEVEAMTLFAADVPAHEIEVRPGLQRGTPPPSFPPSAPWGERQDWPHANTYPWPHNQAPMQVPHDLHHAHRHPGHYTNQPPARPTLPPFRCQHGYPWC